MKKNNKWLIAIVYITVVCCFICGCSDSAITKDKGNVDIFENNVNDNVITDNDSESNVIVDNESEGVETNDNTDSEENIENSDSENNVDNDTVLDEEGKDEISSEETDSELNNTDESDIEDSEITDTDTQIPYKIKYIKSKANSLNIRSAPSIYAESLGMINKKDMVLYVGKEGDWYKTYYKGSEAYISASSSYTEIYEMESSSEESIERIIEIGGKLLGTEYVYGAKRLHNGKGKLNAKFTDKEFDCSSFVQYMFYYGADILLNTTTRSQSTQGFEVQKEDIKRGDLMYFTNESRKDKSGVERIGHVALYLGDNYILHTASDYAVIEPISKTRWSYLICIRRHI